MTTEETLEHILGSVEDLVSNFLYYDRKEDEDLPVGKIEEMIKDKNISADELVERFRQALMKNLGVE
jgi:hypothetical protein